MNRNKPDIDTFLILARRGESEYKLRGIIDRAPVQEVTSWTDKEGMDLMHNVIIANNVEAVDYLLTHGFFVRPHVPKTTPYSHLASLLGERALLQVLLQHRPDDFYSSTIPITLPPRVVELVNSSGKSHRDTLIKLKDNDEVDAPSSSSLSPPSSNGRPSSSSSSIKRPSSASPKFYIESLETFLANIEESPSEPLAPLDVASRTGQLECVKVILNQCVLKHHAQDSVDGNSHQSSDISLACIADSPRALALILHKKTPSKTDWEAAVDVCLRRVHPDCLDMLLQLGFETRHMFKSMNFFHVMFTSASMRGTKSYPRMAQTTEILVSHGHKVNSRMPCRTFPLYTLLSNAFCFRDYHNTDYYVKALRILLKHGANPNYDEVGFEKKHPRQAANKAVGRPAYSSALHCLLETAETYAEDLDSPVLAVKFIEDCASVIMRSDSANMNVVGALGDPNQGRQGSILHQLAKSSVVMGANAEIFRCVLRHGADPNLKVNDKYAINVYFDKLFESMKTDIKTKVSRGDHSNNHNSKMENAKIIMRLSNFMFPSAIRDCLNLFVKDHGKESSPQIQTYVETVKEELGNRSQRVQSLVRASAWCVWKACGYKGDSVHTLKVSSELKTYILPMSF